MNFGSFKGAGSNTLTGKKGKAIEAIEWYKNKKYDLVENYIRDEAAAFIDFYQK